MIKRLMFVLATITGTVAFAQQKPGTDHSSIPAKKSGKHMSRVIHKTDKLTITRLSANAFVHTTFLQTESFGNVPCNGMIVTNNGEAVIFDTTPDSTTSALLINWVQQELACSINAVVVTHFHADNLGGLKAFEHAGIPSYANMETIQYAKERNENLPRHGFRDSIELKAGNKKVVARYFGAGHTRDNIVGYFPDDKILFGGCLIKELNAAKGNLADAIEDDWSQTVENIKKAYPELRWVIPGHGKPGDTALLDYTIGLFKTR